MTHAQSTCKDTKMTHDQPPERTATEATEAGALAPYAGDDGRNPACCARAGGFICLAVQGHAGDHVAYASADTVCHTWPQDPADEAPARDIIRCLHGHPDCPEPGHFEAARYVPVPVSDDQGCADTDPQGFSCTLIDGHPGDHMAHTGPGPDAYVAETWPQATPLTAELDGNEISGRPDLGATPAGQHLHHCQECGGIGTEPTHHDHCPTGKRAAYIDGLRQLTTALEQHPEIGLPVEGTGLPLTFSFWDNDAARAQMAATARALPCTWDKEASDTYLRLRGRIAGLHVELVAYRDAVCTRVVTGTEEREVEVEVTPAVTEKRTETVDVVEWDCGSLLAPRSDGAA
jgi:hypothetical protein